MAALAGGAAADTAAAEGWARAGSVPFRPEEAEENLPQSLSESTWLEIHCNDEPLFSHTLRYVGKQMEATQSIRAEMARGLTRGRLGLGEDDDIDDVLVMVKGVGKLGKGGRNQPGRKRKREVQMPNVALGLGWHTFPAPAAGAPAAADAAAEGAEAPAAVSAAPPRITALLQRLGEPTGESPTFFQSLVLFARKGQQELLLRVCQAATEAATQQKQNRVSLWRFDTKALFWMRITRRLARSLDSVVVEDVIKQPLLDDVEWFVKEETRAFYAKHGIPYHRCYLFHGEPGTGKTSFISALAGHLERNLCFIQMDKSMTDDTFRTAMTQLPPVSMVVLEDVDALFTNHREADHAWSSLSFSGFLNCLDGLGAPDDVVVCLTTNHPERLDPAVMRPGRIDLKVAFRKPGREVAVKYFLTFYPGAEDAAAAFGKDVGSRISERKVSMAQLQHFFLACHRQDLAPDKAAEHIRDFVFDDFPSGTAWSKSYS